jgi:ligand-binding sensor domain-containing protein
MRTIVLSLFIGFSILTSTDSLVGQWVRVNTPVPKEYSECCFTVSGADLFVGTWGGGIFLSTDNGTSWSAVNTGLTCLYIEALTQSGTNLLAGTYGSGIFLSTNNGTSWTETKVGPASSQISPQSVRFVKNFTRSGTNIFARTGAGIFLSADSGMSWSSTGEVGDNGPLAVMGNYLFTGTVGRGVLHSENNGISWTAVNSGLLYPYVSALAVIDTNLFAGTYGCGVFLSTNKGAKWIQANVGMMNLRYPQQNADLVNALAVSGKNLFAGTGCGVFISTNNGMNWESVGLKNSYVVALAVVGPNLFAGVHGDGIWMRPLALITGVTTDPSTDVPAHCSLEQNYPDPFNPSTTISFSLPGRSYVSLKVYDIMGREVATILSEELPAGHYARTWNAARVSSGVYFYRMQAGAFNQTKKFVLLK